MRPHHLTVYIMYIYNNIHSLIVYLNDRELLDWQLSTAYLHSGLYWQVGREPPTIFLIGCWTPDPRPIGSGVYVEPSTRQQTLTSQFLSSPHLGPVSWACKHCPQPTKERKQLLWNKKKRERKRSASNVLYGVVGTLYRSHRDLIRIGQHRERNQKKKKKEKSIDDREEPTSITHVKGDLCVFITHVMMHKLKSKTLQWFHF